MLENKKIYMPIDTVNPKSAKRYMDIFAFLFEKKIELAMPISFIPINKPQNDGEKWSNMSEEKQQSLFNRDAT